MKNHTRPISATETSVPGAGKAYRHGGHCGGCACFIIPPRVLERFANDNNLTAQQRQYFADAAKLE